MDTDDYPWLDDDWLDRLSDMTASMATVAGTLWSSTTNFLSTLLSVFSLCLICHAREPTPDDEQWVREHTLVGEEFSESWDRPEESIEDDEPEGSAVSPSACNDGDRFRLADFATLFAGKRRTFSGSLSVFDQSLSCLWDTGSTVTLIDERALRDLSQRSHRHAHVTPVQGQFVQIADSSGMEITGSTTLPVTLGTAHTRATVPTTFYIVRNLPTPVLLGLDFMSRCDALIDVRGGRVELRGLGLTVDVNAPDDLDTPHLNDKLTLALADHAEVPALHERAVRVRLVGSPGDVAAARSSTCWFQPGALPQRFAAKQGWLTRTEWRDTESGVEGEVLLANFSAVPERLVAGQSLGALSIAPAYEAAFVAPSELQRAVESEGVENGQRVVEDAPTVPSSDLPPSFVHGLDERMVPPIPRQAPHARVLARVQQLEEELRGAKDVPEGVPFDWADLERRASVVDMTGTS
jgi:hypothetical protein